MLSIRIIPKLEVKGPNLIKGIHLEGLRIVGKPEDMALKYYEDGADELIYMDLVASLYQRKYLLNIIEKAAQKIFIPLTVGGGVKTIRDMRILFKAGADKIAINTGAVTNPRMISEAARIFGSQCIVVSIEAQVKYHSWEVYTDSGRTPTGIDVLDWAKQAVKLGAGELLLTSIDRDGTYNGYDLELIKLISSQISVPVIACGGASKKEHFLQALEKGHADAICAASVFHQKKLSIKQIKKYLDSRNIPVRI